MCNGWRWGFCFIVISISAFCPMWSSTSWPFLSSLWSWLCVKWRSHSVPVWCPSVCAMGNGCRPGPGSWLAQRSCRSVCTSVLPPAGFQNCSHFGSGKGSCQASASASQVRNIDIAPGHLVLGSDFLWDKLVAWVSSSFSSLFCGGISVSLTSAAHMNPEFCSQPPFHFPCSHRMTSIVGKQNKRVIEFSSPAGTIPPVQALKHQPLEDGASPAPSHWAAHPSLVEQAPPERLLNSRSCYWIWMSPRKLPVSPAWDRRLVFGRKWVRNSLARGLTWGIGN